MKKLSKFGLVVTCKKVHDDVVTVLITHGFKTRLVNSNLLMDELAEMFPDHKTVETMITDDDFAFIVLVNKQPK